jgi:hypothetical protein
MALDAVALKVALRNDPSVLARRDLMRGQMYLYRAMANSSAGYTFANTWALEADFDLVQLIYANDQTTPWTITAASIAPAAQIGNGFIPLNADGAAVPMTAVTFDTAGIPGDPVIGAAGATTSFTVPAAAVADEFAPEFWTSDWMRVSSLPRIDAGSDGRPLLMIRTHSAGQVRGVNLGGANVTAFAAEARGRVLRAGFQGGNQTLAAAPSFAETTAYSAPVGIRYLARSRGVTVLNVGDSLSQGHMTGSEQFFSPAHYATADLSSRGLPVSWVNGARSGSSSVDFIRAGKRSMDFWKPGIAVIEPWSPNDAKDAEASSQSFARALDLANYALRGGCIPIIQTAVPYPGGGMTAGQDAFRKATNDKVRAMGALGSILVADMDAVVTDMGSPAGRLPQYAASSGGHYNAAGYAAMGAALQPVIARALGL